MKGSSVCRVQRFAAVCVAALVAVVASTASAQSVDEVIAKNIKAQGGKDALTKLKSVQRKGDVKVDGSFGQMEGSVEEAAVPWKKARRALDLAVFQQKDGWNGKIAWRDGMEGVKEIEGDDATLVKQVAELNPFLMIKERDIKAEKLEDETVDGTAYYVIQLTTKDKPPVKLFIDKANDQLKRTTLTQNNPQFGEVKVTVEVSGYEDFGPVKLPTKNKVQLGEILTIETTYTDTKVDGEIDEAIFEKPKEPAAN